MNVSDHAYLPKGDSAITSANRVVGIVQARMGSTRMPGKVLQPLAGAPMLQRQLERVQRATTLDQIVVATSDDPSDEPIAEVVGRHRPCPNPREHGCALPGDGDPRSPHRHEALPA